MHSSFQKNNRPELQIILAAILPTSIYNSHILSLVKQNIDWEVLVNLSLSNSVLPLVYERLRHIAATEIPPPILERMRDLYWASISDNLRLTNQVLRLVRQLEERGIPSILFKGPAWAIKIYNDLALRQFEDIDILIKPGDFRTVFDFMTALGFQPEFPVSVPADFLLLKTGHALDFSNAEGMHIEIHWGLSETGVMWPLQPSDYWQGLIPFMLEGRMVNILDPQMDLIYLCIHGDKHQWCSLKWIADLIWFAHHNPDFDWEALLVKATELGFRRIVCLGLYLSTIIGGVDFPPGISKRIESDPWVKRAAENTLGIIEGRIQASKPWDARSSLFYFMARERWRDRLAFLKGRVVEPGRDDWASLYLPKKLFFLYYFTHPFRLLIKYVKRILRK
jgi:hypothetical protein